MEINTLLPKVCGSTGMYCPSHVKSNFFILKDKQFLKNMIQIEVFPQLGSLISLAMSCSDS